ncbi:hypothetical protein [Paenimyroides ceti]
MLWKGIVHTTLRYPSHKYLIGGVSISNQFLIFQIAYDRVYEITLL